MKAELHAEWTKLRTSPGTKWLLAATIAGTIALGAFVCATIVCRTGDCGLDPVKLSLSGTLLGQTVVAILAVLAVGGEYSTGMARLTYTAMPRRLHVLAAKACVVTAAVLAAASVAVPVSLLTGRALLAGQSFTPSTAAVLRAGAGTVLYLGLIALLSLGLATLMRNSAAAIGTVLGLLFVVPVLTMTVTDPVWRRHLEQAAPMSAGLAIQATRDLAGLPLSPWAGLGVLALWAAGALLAGAAALHLRDV
jgi:ABC-2 type transport system permease protein